MEQRQFQSLVDSLIYLSVCTRSDIAHTVSCLTRFSSKPKNSHRTAAKRVLRYLRGTTDYGIMFTKPESEQCVAISDANWEGVNRIKDLHLVTCFRWWEDQYPGKADNKDVWPVYYGG